MTIIGIFAGWQRLIIYRAKLILDVFNNCLVFMNGNQMNPCFLVLANDDFPRLIDFFTFWWDTENQHEGNIACLTSSINLIVKNYAFSFKSRSLFPIFYFYFRIK